ncbi:hypothetical protein V2J09_006339 [Rumex salicifolius]
MAKTIANTPVMAFDSSVLRQQAEIPEEFVWPEHEKPDLDAGELVVPVVDMAAGAKASRVVDEACRKHGFFLVANHGVDPELVRAAHRSLDDFFGLPLAVKRHVRRDLGEHCGYSDSFTGRFHSKLPWKETLSFRFTPQGEEAGHARVVEDYFVNSIGPDFAEQGDNESVMRLNYYPPCQKPEQALGTGPHTDPTSLTILHQDQVGGLQVFVDGQWKFVYSDPDVFVVNIGDTFKALTNGVYKSCLHRAVVNSSATRKSLAFFLNPGRDKVVRAPDELLAMVGPRLYPDFTWPTFLEFTQKYYRSDMNTIQAFSHWIEHKQQPNT